MTRAARPILLLCLAAILTPGLRGARAAGAINLALFQPTKTNERWNTGVKAVDGDTSNDSVAGVGGMPNPWWQVDLRSLCTIQTIRLYNRDPKDWGAARNSFINTFISDTSMEGRTAEDLQRDPAVWKHLTRGVLGTPTDIQVGWIGRYVRVQATNNIGGMDLADVMVMGNTRDTSRLPVARIIGAPAETTLLAPGADLTLEAAARDPETPVAHVDLFADGKRSATASRPSFRFQLQNLTAGVHHFAVRAVDAQGVTGPMSDTAPVRVLSPARTPVIIDTDIADDRDDTFAIALALASPELDVRLITAEPGKLKEHVAPLLTGAGRTDISLALAHDGVKRIYKGEEAAREVCSHYAGPVFSDGIQAIVDTIMGSPFPVTILCLQPPSNIAAALAREPRIAQHARIIAVMGAFNEKDPLKHGNRERNASADIPASQAILAAPWDVVMAPLGTADLVKLSAEQADRIHDGATALARATWTDFSACQWSKTAVPAKNATNFPIRAAEATYLAVSGRELDLARTPVRITDDGYAMADPAGRPVWVATAWKDEPAFGEWMAGRLTQPHPQPTPMPTAALTGPASHTFVAPHHPVRLTARPAAPAGDSVFQVDFYVNGARAGSARSAPYSVVWTATAAGPAVVTAVATNGQGLAGPPSTPLILTAGSSPPPAPLPHSTPPGRVRAGRRS